MTNGEVLKVIDSILFDLNNKDYDNAKSTLKTLQSLLKCRSDLNEFKKIVYAKMQYYYTSNRAKNKELYDFYQTLKPLSHKSFDFATYYQKYLEIIKE